MTWPRDFFSAAAFSSHAALSSGWQSKMNLLVKRSPATGGRPPLFDGFFLGMFSQ